jgi:hypothetical protein
MNADILQAIGAVVFFLVIFISGFSLSRSGKPYSGIVFTLHKLIALAFVVAIAFTLYRTASLGAGEIIAAAAAGVFFLGLFITGGLVSIDKQMPQILLRLHHLLPYLAVLSTAAAWYLLSRPL